MINQQQPQQFSQEQGLASRQAIADVLREENLPIETLAEIGRWAEMVINEPARFPEFQNWLRSQGLEESEIPQEPDMQELSSMVAIGNTAESMMEEQAAAQPAAMSEGAVAGPVSPEQMAQMSNMGRNGDTQLAHINSEEAAMLKQMGGTGTINPATGLPEFGFFSDLWNGVKKVVKKVAPFVLPAVAIFVPTLIPAIGTYLGASAALAPVVGSAVLAGGVTALSGGSAKDVLKSVALSGLGSYITPVLGKYVSSSLGVTSPVLTNVLGSAAFSGGLTALRGGTLANILKDAATGGAASYLGQIASSAINSGKISNTKITQQAFDDAAFAAADAESLAKQGLSESQIKQTLVATGLSSTTAGTAAKLAASGTAAADIAVQLSNSASSSKNLYTDKQTGVQNSVIGGGNVEALETVQRIEDATFIAEDIKQLKAQGLSNTQIRDNLIMAGVDPRVAGNVVTQSGSTVDTIVKNLTSASAYKTTGFFVKDFDPATAARDLGTAPVNKTTTTTPATTTPATTTPATTTPATTTPATTTPVTTTPGDGSVVTFDDGSTITYDTAGRVLGATNADGTIYNLGSNVNLPVTTPATTTPVTGNGGTQTFDDGSTITFDGRGNVVSATNADGTPYVPGSNPALPGNQAGTGEKTQIFDDGSTLTTDANGNVIRSTNSDGTPYVAGSNPNLPANKPGEKTQIFDDGSTLTTDANGNVIRSTNSDGTPYVPGSNPLLPGNTTVTTPPTTVTPPVVVTPPYVPPYVPPERPVTPVDPYAGSYVGDYSFGTVTPPNTRQGINPGFMPGAVDYQTTSPVQSQFDWSKTAYQPGPDYNPALQTPPPVPFGLQQMYTPMSPEQLLQLTQGTNLYAGLLPAGTGR